MTARKMKARYIETHLGYFLIKHYIKNGYY